jgi:hypothetical protein
VALALAPQARPREQLCIGKVVLRNTGLVVFRNTGSVGLWVGQLSALLYVVLTRHRKAAST